MLMVVGGRARRPGRPGGHARAGRWRAARVAAFLIVLFGATVVPLALEVVWRSEGNAALHVQPEVVVVEQAGVRAAHGEGPVPGGRPQRSHPHPPEDRARLRAVLPLPPGHGGLRPLEHERQQGGGPADRCPDPVPGLHRLVALLALSRLRPPTDARSAPSRCSACCPRRPSPGHRGGRHAGGGPHAAGAGRAPAPATGPGRTGPGGGIVPQVHRLAAGPTGPVGASPTSTGAGPSGATCSASARCTVPVVGPGGPAEPLRLHRQRDPVPVRSGRGVITGGQRHARPHLRRPLPGGAPALRGRGRPGGGAVLDPPPDPTTSPRRSRRPPPSPDGSC